MQKIFPLTILIISSIALSGCGYTPKSVPEWCGLGVSTGAAMAPPPVADPARLSRAVRLARRLADVGATRRHRRRPASCYYGPPPRRARFGFDADGNTAWRITAIETRQLIARHARSLAQPPQRKGGRTRIDTPALYRPADWRAALRQLCDPATEVSSHYLVSEDGRLFQLVPEARRAWHAGRGVWAGESDMNDVSIGIESRIPAIGGSPAYPSTQIETVIALCQDVIARWHIRPERVLAHSDVSPAARRSRRTFPLGAIGQGRNWPLRDALSHRRRPAPGLCR